MCRLEEWDSMLNKFDNTWGIVKESGGPSFFLISISSTSISTYIFFFCFQPRSVQRLSTSRRASLGVSWRIPLSKGSGRI